MDWTGVHNLVEKARTGDSPAQAALYQLVEPFLLRQAKRLLAIKGVGKSVRDLVGDTWVRVLKGQDSFRSGNNDEQTGAVLRAWLTTTMRNVLSNDLRRPTLCEGTSLDGLSSTDSNGPCQPSDYGPTPSSDVMNRERMRRVFDCAGSEIGLPVTSIPVWPSASDNGVGTPDCLISQLDGWPACAPVNASPPASRPSTHDSGSG
ncbi:MAG TPA: sigma factor [Gemmataceae bacterium]|nr:sigma factor [Gemmataceae bacterium]